MATTHLELQKWLRQLILRDDGHQAVAGRDGQGIGANTGAVWWQLDTSAVLGDDAPLLPLNPNAPTMGEFDPSQMPKAGEAVAAIGPLFDCRQKGQCVFVRLNGVAKQPASFTAPCTPPMPKVERADDGRAYYYDAWAQVVYSGGEPCDWCDTLLSHVCRPYRHELFTHSLGVFAYDDVVQAMATFVPRWEDLLHSRYATSDSLSLAELRRSQPTGQPSDVKRLHIAANCHGSGFYRAVVNEQGVASFPKGAPMSAALDITKGLCPPMDQLGGVSQSLQAYCRQHYRDPKEAAALDDDLSRQWDAAACSEVIATSKGFEPACPMLHDANMPALFQHHPTAFTLCDASGNPVTIERQASGGFRVDTLSYSAVISPQLRVQQVQIKE